MAQYTQLVQPRTNFREGLGWCLRAAQTTFGAPVRYASATEAANATVRKQYNRNLPSTAAVLLWFDHWGTYGGIYDNWGHVVVHVPGRGYFSSPSVGGAVWFSSIAEVERAFGARFRFWTDNINGLRVAKPAQATKLIKKGLQVIHYHRKDKHARAGGRTLRPGTHLYLNTQNATASQASNIVGGIGPYIVTPHLYATGTPGDIIEVVLMWQDVRKKPAKSSLHYVEQIEIPASGEVKRSVTSQRAVPAGHAVYVRVQTRKTNRGDVKITCLDSDAYLIK